MVTASLLVTMRRALRACGIGNVVVTKRLPLFWDMAIGSEVRNFL
jgi:hypothetical protein